MPRPLFRALAPLACVVLAMHAGATTASYDGTISIVAVNGGADTANPGVTCIQISAPVPGACSGNWIAIQNNNKQLIATAMSAKSTGAPVAVYIDDDSGRQHCPWLAFTTCSATSILLK